MERTASTESALNRKPEVAAEELGDRLVRYLAMLEIDAVFGVPGGAIEPLVDALARSERRGGPRCISARHETGAAFMADGYHVATGRPGVCFATTGPGATNLVTGVASAYANQIPMLVITAQTALGTFGRGGVQESSGSGTDTLAILESVTRYSSLVSHPRQFEHKLATALMTAMQWPRGPVHLSIPIDVLKTTPPDPLCYPYLGNLISHPRYLDPVAFDEFMALLQQSRRIVFVLGDQAIGAMARILEVARAVGADIVVTPHGKGIVAHDEPLFRGVIGFAGHRSAVESLLDPRVDLVVVVGSSLGEWASNGWDAEAILNHRLVHIETCENHFAASPMARLHLRGSIDLVFEKAAEQLEATTGRNIPHPVAATAPRVRSDHETARIADQSPVDPKWLMLELTELFPARTRYLADSGNSFAWAVHYLETPSPPGPDGAFRASMDFAAMGWAIGSAVGAAAGLPGTPVVCITGDGSYLMAGQEITVAIQQRLPVVYMILNDAAYGMVKHGQRLTGAERTSFDLPPIDFAAMGRAMGIDGHVIRCLKDLRALDIEAICATPGPTILDVRIDPEAEPPIGLRTSVLRQSHE